MWNYWNTLLLHYPIWELVGWHQLRTCRRAPCLTLLHQLSFLISNFYPKLETSTIYYLVEFFWLVGSGFCFFVWIFVFVFFFFPRECAALANSSITPQREVVTSSRIVQFGIWVSRSASDRHSQWEKVHLMKNRVETEYHWGSFKISNISSEFLLIL